MELLKFIVKAKKNTYANGKKPKILEDGSEEFIYEEEDYMYRDRYYARDPKQFGGEEIVWQNAKVVWIMNYYGRILSDKINSKKIYEFLKDAMSLVDEQKPFRGPSQHKKGDFEYINETEGSLENFKGTEKILYGGKKFTD